MNFKNIPLLITSAINPVANYTNLKNQEERINATKKSINFWISIGIKKIVLCDGSDYDLKKNFSNLIEKENQSHQIELISFKNNHKNVKKLGKGFGEGEIIRKALKTSIFLKNSDFFMKCTSKLWVENFFEISKNFNGIFLSDVQGLLRPKMVDTRFYISSKSFFLENLMSAYLDVNDDDGRFLEHCYMRKIREKKLSGWISKKSINIVGLSGTSGKFQKRGYFKQVLRSMRNKFFIFIFK